MAKRRLLLVEDDPASASAMAAILGHYGLDVVTVTHVSGALVALRDYFEFVILDLMLPDGDGSTVLNHIRAVNMPAHVCVVTAMCDHSALGRVQKLNPQCILRKPIDVADLLNGLNIIQ